MIGVIKADTDKFSDLADTWADKLLDSGCAEDVIGLDREAWAQLPQSNSVVWRNAAKVAIPLLAERP